MLHTVIFIGRSGAGKGTQCDLLRERIHRLDDKKRQILHIETGEHFRRFVRGKNYSSRLSHEIYREGIRQPDFLSCYIWSSVLIDELGEDMHLVFDGAPRARDEAEILTTALKFYKRENPTVIYINVSKSWSEKRLLARGRVDDLDLKDVEKKMAWFDKDVVPAIDYFKSNPYYRFLEIEGEQPIEKVHSDIVAMYEYA